ncbi:MAG: hypothetical protein LBS86_00690, partial [Treponema sp.]|nr:hypothetical protein [Treponema sp.]
MIKFFRILTPLVFLGIAVGIGKLVLFPQNGVSGASEVGESRFARIMTPAQRVVDEEPQAEATIVPLDQDETLVRVMAYDFDPELPGEEQLLVSRKNAQKDNLLSVTYLANGARLWTVTTPITRPWTVAMDSIDVLGNHA